MKKIIIIVFISINFLLLSRNTKAAENEEIFDWIDIDYDEIQDAINNILEEKINFEDYVKSIVNGENKFDIVDIVYSILNYIKNELQNNLSGLATLIGLCIFSAIFTNFSSVFKNSQVSEVGFFVTYLLLFSILCKNFLDVTKIASNCLGNIFTFMKGLIPAYCISIAFCGGTTSSAVLYQVTLIIISIADFILLKLIMPCINIYFIIVLANNISKEDLLSKFSKLLKDIITWGLNTLLSVVVGIGAIQSIIAPMTDKIKNTLIFKATNIIPAVGGSINAVTESVLSIGVIIKNAIGITGLIIIIMICSAPLLKLISDVLIYKVGIALLQPVSDNRVLNCMNVSAEASLMLFRVVFSGVILFLFTVGIIAIATNFSI